MLDSHLNRGKKRKRVEIPVEASVNISGKLHHHLKDVRKAAKKAKTFETQKLVKKLKGLRRKDETSQEITELVAQLEVLKRTDHEPIASAALKAKLNKDRILSENADVQTALSTEISANTLVPAAPGTTAAKVQNRLLSSKALASNVATVIEDLKASLQSGEPTMSMETLDETGDSERPPKANLKDFDALDTQKRRVNLQGDGDESDSDRSDVNGPGEQDNAGWESGTVGDDEEEGDVRFESGSLDADANDPSDEEVATDIDEENQENVVSGDDLQIKSSGRKAAIVMTNPQTTEKQTTFLPSLAVGYIRGDSDDLEWSDGDGMNAGAPLKKNRRGQRARQAIWEKKYGNRANHKAKKVRTNEEAPTHRSGSAAAHHQKTSLKKTWNSAHGQSVHTHLRRAVDSGWEQRETPQNSTVSGSISASRQGARHSGGGRKNELHPSWEAKKKLKEKQNAAIVPPQGKKIKFS